MGININKCPSCGNEKIIMVGEESSEVEYSVATGKCLRRVKGSLIWWMYTCKCGWKSETNTE